MKILFLIITLFTSLNLNNNYQSRKDKFHNIINDSYDSYTVHNINLTIGDLVLIIGEIDNKYSFSIYFNNKVSEDYNINIYDINNEKKYVLSNYESYQIYYNIKLEENSKYYLFVDGKNTTTSYYKYMISSNNEDYDNIDLTIGKGQNSFPYTTKLKNKISKTTVYFIIGTCVIVFELVILIIFLKKKKTKINQPSTLNYEIIE